MKILHISTHKKGGAANAAIRIHNSLVGSGLCSFFLTLEQSDVFISNHVQYDGVYNTKHFIYPTLTLKNLIKEKIFKTFSTQNRINNFMNLEKNKFTAVIKENNVANFTLFSYPNSIYDITTTSAYLEADIIHLHWVAGFIDYESFFMKINKPIIWTLHDENPYLGGFHYHDDVKNNSKTHGSKEQEFVSLKAECIKHTKKISIISPSNWIAKKAKESLVFKDKRVNVIRNIVDKSVFKIRDQAYSRDLFQLPQDKKIILVASQDLSVPRKGVRFIEALLTYTAFDDFLFVFAGNNSTLKKSNIIALGPINDEILMSCLYSAADYFLLPSLLDNLPNTLLESMYCGTPVIAFKIGDFEEIFEGNNIGLLVDEGDIEGLKNLLVKIQQDKYSFDRDYIVNKAHELFSEEQTIQEYIQEYQLLLNE